jgi:membrane protein implicated in regulation of membrane protease activity
VAWVVWVVLAVLLAIGELLTPGLFFLGPLALAAGAAGLASALGAGTVGSVIVFLVGSLFSLVLLRPVARRHIRVPAISRTGTDALVGRRAIVTRKVDAAGGRVRIGGEEWSARSYLDDEEYDEGAAVDVVKIEGATALVSQ